MSTYEITTLIIVLINVALGLVIYPMRESIKESNKRMQSLSDELYKEYVSKSDMREHLERQEKTLSELKAYLAAKHNI